MSGNLPPQDSDREAELRDRVGAACADHRPLRLLAGGSKADYTREVAGERLDLAGHCGVVRYEPTEMVITARCGTRVADLAEILDAHGQMLAFEPANRHGVATIGGVIACGLSGPRRPYAGSVRDSVLGCRLLSGRGEVLRFGGEVMKNVAGFDVSRLLVGSLGTLGIVLEVSLKVVPAPCTETTVCFDVSETDALRRMAELSRFGLPLSGMAYDGRLRVRIAGAESAVRTVAKRLGGEEDETGAQFWAGLREQDGPFFQRGAALWRVSVPPATRGDLLTGECLYDWGGGLRWYRTNAADESVFLTARSVNGHATRFAVGETPRHSPLDPGLLRLHRAVKQAFDPNRVLNPGALYREL